MHLHVVSKRFSVRINGPFGKPAARNLFALAGTVKPARPGSRVALQRRSSAGVWATVSSVALSRSSTFSFANTESAAGQYAFRVTKPGDNTAASGTSQPIYVTVASAPSGVVTPAGDRTLRIDVNGDGLTDLLEITPRGPTGFNIVPLINTGTSYRYGGLWYDDTSAALSDTDLIPADVNGDGKTDLIEVTPRGSTGFNVVPLTSNGTDAFTYGGLWYHDASATLGSTQLIPEDINGDGKTDLLEVTPRGAFGFNVVPLISNGTSAFQYGGLWYAESQAAIAYGTSTALLIGTPTSVPAPSNETAAAENAIAWAESYSGQYEFAGKCQRFVHEAYLYGGNIDIGSVGSAGSAKDYWASNPRGYTEHPGDRSPPVGALVFWGPTGNPYPNPDGHVGIYLGNDQVISSASWPESDTGPIHTFSFSGRNSTDHGLYPYLGWLVPGD
jgi:cell wall-associated NlpC family hydrolase